VYFHVNKNSKFRNLKIEKLIVYGDLGEDTIPKRLRFYEGEPHKTLVDIFIKSVGK